jgi:CheY-like chemotaxis protein
LGNPERDHAKGLGLGLAICRRLAALLAAPMGVRSRPGRGSAFWIDLPVAPADAAGAGAADGGIPWAGELSDPARLTGTVLVVEADALVRAGMGQTIVGWGGSALLAAGREDAWRCCRECASPPDLVICNISLVGALDGIGLAQELQREFTHMGALLVSADVSESSQTAARRAGFALLKQPVPPGRLRAALQQLLTVHA